MSLYPVLSLSIGSRWGPPLPKLMIVTESAGVGVVGELSPVRLVSCQLAAKSTVSCHFDLSTQAVVNWNELPALGLCSVMTVVSYYINSHLHILPHECKLSII